MSHKRNSPSKSGRTLLCAAAPGREEALPDDPGGEAANQGSNSHFCLEQAIIEDRWPPAFIGDGGNNFLAALPFTADGCPPELRDMAHDCFFYAKGRQEALGVGTLLQAESKVSPRYFTGRDDSDGTVDVSIVALAQRFLEIVDLKTGGSLVEPDCSQLRLYALGKMAEYVNPETGAVPFDKVRLTVYQPKRPGVDTVERYIDLTPDQLMEWAANVWVPAAQASDNPNAVGTPTDEGCKYCKAKKHGTCPEYKAALEGTAQMLFQPVEQEWLAPQASAPNVAPVAQIDPMMSEFSVDQLSPEQISRFLEIWPIIKARGKDIEARAVELLKARTPVPGFKLVEGDRRRAWALEDEEEQAQKFKNMKLTLDQIFLKKLRSPAQMKALGLDMKKWKNIEKHIVWKEGGLTLVPSSDKRADAMPAVEFQPVETPAAEPVETAPAVDMSFLNL